MKCISRVHENKKKASAFSENSDLTAREINIGIYE